jgi:hypothetical protein
VNKNFLFALLTFSFFHVSLAQNILPRQELLPGIVAEKITSPVQVDGVLEEHIWQEEGWVTGFYQTFPFDTSLAIAQTRVKLAYDDKFLYFAAVMLNPGPRDRYISTSLRRDYRGDQNDGVSLIIDTFNDKTNAYQFGVNPYGVQRESLISNGGNLRTDLNLAWDNKWHSAARIHEDHWVVEMAIPFSTLRYKEGSTSWNVNFYRIDSEYAEKSTWTPIPRNFNVINLAFSRKRAEAGT